MSSAEPNQEPFEGDHSPRQVSRSCRVACVQMNCENLQPERNIAKAQKLVAQAAEQGAEVVLLPELMAAGYLLSKETWDVSEPTTGGRTERFLAQMSQDHGVYIGSTFLEAAGDGHFYNTFLLYHKGKEMGRIRKYRPASFEAFLFSWHTSEHRRREEQEDHGEPKGDNEVLYRAKSKRRFFSRSRSKVSQLSPAPSSASQTALPLPHIIDTPIGRFGVSICYESFVSSVIKSLAESNIDLLLMPFSCPKAKHPGPFATSFNDSVDVFISKLKEIPITLSQMLGVPAMFCNKTGDWRSPIPLTLQTISGRFPGGCTITDQEGNIVARAKTRDECVVVADVQLGRKGVAVSEGEWRKAVPRDLSYDDAEEVSVCCGSSGWGESSSGYEEVGESCERIPDYGGYIFSPPWMIMCLWWVSEWLGGLVYSWSWTRKQKALRNARASVHGL